MEGLYVHSRVLVNQTALWEKKNAFMCIHKSIINFTDIKNVCSIHFANKKKNRQYHKASWVLRNAGWFLLNPFIRNLPVVHLMKGCNSHINTC